MRKKGFVIGGLAATAVLIGGWAFAQSTHYGMGGMSGMGPGMRGLMGITMRDHMGPGMRGRMGSGSMRGGPRLMRFDPGHIDQLKTELGITAAQEPAWTKYAGAIQETAASMQTTRASVNPGAVRKMSQQDRIAFMTKLMDQHQKRFESVHRAATELLATLDDAQKAKAHDILPGLASVGPGAMRNGIGGQQNRK